MQENMNNKTQKQVKNSAFIAILNKLMNDGKISENEYKKIKDKIEKKC